MNKNKNANSIPFLIFLGYQIGTPWADGTALISQCPIKPDETFIYKFQADKVYICISINWSKLLCFE